MKYILMMILVMVIIDDDNCWLEFICMFMIFYVKYFSSFAGFRLRYGVDVQV